jgi:hypothetical protein
LTPLGHNLSPGNPYDAAKSLPNRDVRHGNSIDYASPNFKGSRAGATRPVVVHGHCRDAALPKLT